MSIKNYSRTEFVNDLTQVVLKPPVGERRDYILIQNLSANDIYINFDTHADASNGFTVAAGLYFERDKNAPQNDIYVKGAAASPAQQKIAVVEGVQ